MTLIRLVTIIIIIMIVIIITIMIIIPARAARDPKEAPANRRSRFAAR